MKYSARLISRCYKMWIGILYVPGKVWIFNYFRLYLFDLLCLNVVQLSFVYQFSKVFVNWVCYYTRFCSVYIQYSFISWRDTLVDLCAPLLPVYLSVNILISICNSVIYIGWILLFPRGIQGWIVLPVSTRIWCNSVLRSSSVS